MPVILDICNSPGFGMVSGFGAYFMLISVQAKVNLIPYFTIDCYFLTSSGAIKIQPLRLND